MSPKRLQDVFKTYLQDVFSVTIFCLQDVLKTYCLEDEKLLHWRRFEDVFKTNKCLLGLDINILKTNSLKKNKQCNSIQMSLTKSNKHFYRRVKDIQVLWNCQAGSDYTDNKLVELEGRSLRNFVRIYEE